MPNNAQNLALLSRQKIYNKPGEQYDMTHIYKIRKNNREPSTKTKK